MILNNKTALVTGGGKGIGRGITEKMLKAGANVIIAQRSQPDADLAMCPNLTWMYADFKQSDSPSSVADAIGELHPGIDILVNNTGIMSENSLEELSVEQWDEMMTVNVRAPLFLTRALLPLMKKRGGGSIINIGSIEGLAANPHHIAYCASKAAVHGFSRALAVDLGKDNIRCNIIAPGWIDSALSETYINSRPDADSYRSQLAKLHPLGRTGNPEDVGDLAVFLASDSASFITGQTFIIDGGRTAQLPSPHP